MLYVIKSVGDPQYQLFISGTMNRDRHLLLLPRVDMYAELTKICLQPIIMAVLSFYKTLVSYLRVSG